MCNYLLFFWYDSAALSFFAANKATFLRQESSKPR
ncbi:Uncharacterised protein [Vibrio cholerae]|nr:Uncharacterised protein [Vibrio cholerae]